MKLEKKQSGPEMAQNKPSRKAGKTDVRYWSPRLVKRDYEYDGKTREVANWYARIAHLGRREWFNLSTPNRDAAATKARDIWLSLRSSGWDATMASHKPGMEVIAGGITVEDFGKLYREAVQKVEYPPSHRTAERYLKDFSRICRDLKVRRLADLTQEKVADFKGTYLAAGREQKFNEDSVKVSCNALLRNAAALFSKQMVAKYQTMGHKLSNPFEGQKLRRLKLKSYSPLRRELLDSIWAEASKLRDGDPDAATPVKAIAKKGEKRKRWTNTDFRKPHPEAYTLLLLELGLGLRRHEADKAQKDWFLERGGRYYIEVKETPYFKPKSKEMRTISVEPVLFSAIEAIMGRHVSPFIVSGRLPKRYEDGSAPKNIVYRCDQHHRDLAAWLRAKGIKDEKPCHLLRKEFGSYVATAFGLFHAQKMLGHSSPAVTEAFYAGLTNLPELSHAQIAKTGGAK
jgi:hypothetical protein